MSMNLTPIIEKIQMYGSLPNQNNQSLRNNHPTIIITNNAPIFNFPFDKEEKVDQYLYSSGTHQNLLKYCDYWLYGISGFNFKDNTYVLENINTLFCSNSKKFKMISKLKLKITKMNSLNYLNNILVIF